MTISNIAKQGPFPESVENIHLRHVKDHFTYRQIVVLGIWKHENFKRTWAIFASKYDHVLGLETKTKSLQERERRQQITSKFRACECVCACRILVNLDFLYHEQTGIGVAP
ncbi:hypothetical protein FOZ60_013283 [Perkinsus olseni]|uniref:Uncharacterized protein n=1 Tax=Perkinsus olseni TaxID=32597 RepID=A0A7J6N9E9_PEROL|nr:hypothetical protein FOZ60_013283 [Perkinsus olseni]